MELGHKQNDTLLDWFHKSTVDNTLELECNFSLAAQKLTRTDFSRLLEFCRNKKEFSMLSEKKDTLDVLFDDYRLTVEGLDSIQTYCQTEDLEKIFSKSLMKKKLINKMQNYEYGIKFNLKQELNFDIEDENGQDPKIKELFANWNVIGKRFRLKRRYSYSVGPFQIDLTVVKNSSGVVRRFIDSQTNSSPQFFEVEVEYAPQNVQKGQNMKNVLKDYTDVISQILYVKDDIWKIVPKHVITEVEREFVRARANTYFHEDSFSQIKQNILPGPSVVSLNMDRFRKVLKDKQNYSVVAKTDGIRMLGFVNSRGELFLLSQTHGKSFIATDLFVDEKYKNSILDGELVKTNKHNDTILHYLVFDCYYARGMDVRQKSLYERMSEAKNIFHVIKSPKKSLQRPEQPELSVFVKDYVSCGGNFHENMHSFMKKMEQDDQYLNDGIIFTPHEAVGGAELYSKPGFIKSNITWDRLLKWKDARHNTIDFRVIFGEDTSFYDTQSKTMVHSKTVVLKTLLTSSLARFDLETYEKEKKYISKAKQLKEIEFRPFEPEDREACITTLPLNALNKARCQNQDEIYDGAIIEMSYEPNNPPKRRWIPRNARYDKTRPNADHVAQDIWKIIHLPVTYEHLTDVHAEIPELTDEYDEYYILQSNKLRENDEKLRRFHTKHVKKDLLINDETRQLASKGKKPHLLDLACGKGGDLNRYLSSPFTYIVGVDNRQDNIENPHNGAYKRLTGLHPISKQIYFLHGDVSQQMSNLDAFHESKDMYKKFAKKTFNSQNPKFDMISIFFALHYMFESETLLDRFLTNIKENVKIGGYFTGCCYDGETVFNLLQKGRLSFQKNRTEFLSILPKYEEKQFPANKNSLGMKINALVQSIGKPHDEYLVNFQYLENKMHALGFETIHTKFFKEYYKESFKSDYMSPEEQHASFLNRSFLFKRIN